MTTATFDTSPAFLLDPATNKRPGKPAAYIALDPETRLRNEREAYDALIVAAAERRTRDEQHARTMIALRKAQQLLAHKRRARRVLLKIIGMEAAALAVLGVAARAFA